MTERETNILRGALELPVETRAEFVAELISSLDEEREQDVQRAWADEISRRVDAVRDGRLKGVDWRPALAALEKEILRQ